MCFLDISKNSFYISWNMKYFNTFCILLVILSVSNCGHTTSQFFQKVLGGISKSYERFSNWVYAKHASTHCFHLFTRDNLNNSDVYEVNVTNNGELFKKFNPKNPTKILIHGWRGSVESTFCTLLKDTYLDVGDYNIIIFDWSNDANKSYRFAKTAVTKAGKIVASFIDSLVKKHKVKSEDLHLIGHSLGAHVSGVAGYFTTTGQIGRITGLDPSLPLYLNVPESEKLSNKSANFVDIIHTCALYLGIWSNIGHADFYPNKGTFIQPGCGFDALGKCSHNRSYYYFMESIENPSSFIATKCDNWYKFANKGCSNETKVVMGEHCLSSTGFQHSRNLLSGDCR
ncbi:pancreatic triacylglycerol lipase-like isoform X2 [Cimex lectularius]|uniref:Lipase domain-containing protein n=1 Tax=Cimex lectularius TaxID=79782 RepID=A0A8I6RFY4_CIMLE|nr:pancreatic triacylglycerol lipase-like isoform X2 [Cimex lectularius]